MCWRLSNLISGLVLASLKPLVGLSLDMGPNLPLKIRAGIRDLYDPDTSSVKVALRELAKVCRSWPYEVDLNWTTLREEIPLNVLDNDILVANVVDAVTIFLRRLITMITPEGDDTNILDHFVFRTQGVRLVAIKVHPVKDGAVTFTRFTADGITELYLPRMRGGYAPNSSFGHDILEALLSGVSSVDPRAALPSAEDEPEVEFVDVGGTRTRAHQIVFPDVSQIPRPENLLRQAPLYLRLKEGHPNPNGFELEGHQASVDLIHSYLQLHSTPMNVGLISMVKKKMTWGTSLSVLSVQDNRNGYFCSPLVAVALIEGILGFQRISLDLQSKTWLFQRDKPFSNI